MMNNFNKTFNLIMENYIGQKKMDQYEDRKTHESEMTPFGHPVGKAVCYNCKIQYDLEDKYCEQCGRELTKLYYK